MITPIAYILQRRRLARSKFPTSFNDRTGQIGVMNQTQAEWRPPCIVMELNKERWDFTSHTIGTQLGHKSGMTPPFKFQLSTFVTLYVFQLGNTVLYWLSPGSRDEDVAS